MHQAALPLLAALLLAAACGGEEPSPTATPSPSPTTVAPTKTSTPLAAATVTATPAYGGALRAGVWAEIAGTGNCLNVREVPGVKQPSIINDCLPDGYVGYLVGEPRQVDGHWWWKLAGVGWAAEEALRFYHEGFPWPQRPELADAGEIAYVGADGNIWLMGADGSDQRRLTEQPPPGRVTELAWSPRGDLLALATGGPSTILVIDLAGEAVLEIANAVSPSWSSDGSRLAYLGDIQQGEMEISAVPSVMSIPSREMRPVADRASFYQGGPRWSPAGLQLLYDGPLGIHLVDVSGPQPAERVVVGSGENRGNWSYAQPVWSPDGQAFVFRFRDFALAEAPDSYALYSLAEERVIFQVGTKGGCGREAGPEDWQTDWTPDGRYFLDRGECADDDLSNGIWAVDTQERTERRLLPVQGAHLTLSPDGRHLAFEVEGSLIWAADSDGSGLTLLAEGRLPAWRPAGL
ncbi:MAG: hypothetical protein Q8P22_13660 [Chloroflexota bacterium]|nr:hypothetical protein [Chloroflexota bacterium]